MPGMSGLDLLPKAKAARPDLPVIMITAYGDAETRRKALANGADAFLTKPIDFSVVRGEIDTRVGHAAGARVFCGRRRQAGPGSQSFFRGLPAQAALQQADFVEDCCGSTSPVALSRR